MGARREEMGEIVVARVLEEPVLSLSRTHSVVVHNLPDHAIRELLDHPDNLRELVEEAAPELVPHLNFRRARVEKRDYALEDWRERQNDLLIRIPYHAPGRRPILICILIEHQSTSSPVMPLRMLVYAVLYWEKKWKTWTEREPHGKTLRLPAVLGIVFYTGVVRWKGPRSIAEMIDGPEALRKGSPSWDLRFVELRDRKPEEWARDPRPWWTALAVLRGDRLRAKAFREVFAESLERLQPLHREDRVRWEDLMRFVIALAQRRRVLSEVADLHAAALASQQQVARRRRVNEMWNVVKGSLEDEALKRGEARGEARGVVLGRLESRREDLQRLLERRFGPLPEPVRQRIGAESDPERLAGALVSVLDITELAEFRL